MCGIAGVISLSGEAIPEIRTRLTIMSLLIEHRGPDGDGIWVSDNDSLGFAHRRLSIIDLTEAGRQPMSSEQGNWLVHNGEIYNHEELREQLSASRKFYSQSDTEVILAAYEKFGVSALEHLRGMWAFALWDQKQHSFFASRDRFGIKPFYYTVSNNNFYFASEPKALMPFLKEIKTDKEGLAEYLTFQYNLNDMTLFEGIKQIPPAHFLTIKDGHINVRRYWDVEYEIDYSLDKLECEDRLNQLLTDSVRVHLRSDVEVGAYLSGGVDSSLISTLASENDAKNKKAFHGKFTCFEGYDESNFAESAAKLAGKELYQIDITATDFLDNIEKVIYSLDYPVAGPGSFPQFMTSKLASEHVKVVLGGQGGDEIFGGYARYLIAYWEQCMKAAIEGTYKRGNFVVTAESIIPNLGVLREYKPMLQSFWKEGLFEELDRRYFRLCDRSVDMSEEVRWSELGEVSVFEKFSYIFNSRRNVRHEAYFDSMTHYDFKTLLPALLQVEDRMSMAHGLESRVPLLDHKLIEFVATVPADVKFKDGKMKQLLKTAFSDFIPQEIMSRRDKMGFPVPLKEWASDELNCFMNDIFNSNAAKTREFFNADVIKSQLGEGGRYSRKMWGLLSLELWQRLFHDETSRFKGMMKKVKPEAGV